MSNSPIQMSHKKEKNPINLKRQNVLVQRWKKVNIVVEKCFLPQTLLAYERNRNLYVLTEKVSGCERQIANFSRTTAKAWPPEDSQNCWTELEYQDNDTKVKFKQPDSDIAQNRKGSIHLKRQNVFVKRRQKVNKVVWQCCLLQTSLHVIDTGVLMFESGVSELEGTM